ncbi:MAG: rhomboid family intramembrane serine protease, partial [Halofilum sp. (in: g-proteobacteria)]
MVAAVAAFIGLLWLIHGIAMASGGSPGALGIRPRDPIGLIGVVTAPLVHGSASHLFSNTLPLFVLGTALLFGSPRAARIVVPVLWLGSGLAVWLFARDAMHLGASGLAYGMMTFVFLTGVLRRDARSAALSMLVFFLHGSMIWGVLPLREGISFESHLAGAVIGLFLAPTDFQQSEAYR